MQSIHYEDGMFKCSGDFLEVKPKPEPNVYGIHLLGNLTCQGSTEIRLVTGVILPAGKKVKVKSYCGNFAPGFGFVDV